MKIFKRKPKQTRQINDKTMLHLSLFIKESGLGILSEKEKEKELLNDKNLSKNFVSKYKNFSREMKGLS